MSSRQIQAGPCAGREGSALNPSLGQRGDESQPALESSYSSPWRDALLSPGTLTGQGTQSQLSGKGISQAVSEQGPGGAPLSGAGLEGQIQ